MREKDRIYTENLQVGYDHRVVVDGVEVQAVKGKMICLLGPNGAGKSTILRTLSGMLAPVRGAVYLDGEKVTQMEKSTLARKMAVVLTERLSPGMMTAFEIAAMGRHPYTGFFGKLKEEDKAIVMESLRNVNAENLAFRYYEELSDGEKQKVMIARALAQQPELIVLDEPTSHLDIRHRIEVVNILGKLCREKGLTVILSLHDIDLALKGCELVLMVKDGQVIEKGRPEEIVRQGVVQNLYGIHNAYYDDLLGSLELTGPEKPRVFLTGGAGTGILLYRSFCRAGYGIACGVLAENDVDAHVARALSETNVFSEAFVPVSREKEQEAEALMKKMELVVDTGFPLREENAENGRLLREAVRSGKTVLSLRPEKEAETVYSEYRDQVLFFESAEELMKKAESLLGGMK